MKVYRPIFFNSGLRYRVLLMFLKLHWKKIFWCSLMHLHFWHIFFKTLNIYFISLQGRSHRWIFYLCIIEWKCTHQCIYLCNDHPSISASTCAMTIHPSVHLPLQWPSIHQCIYLCNDHPSISASTSAMTIHPSVHLPLQWPSIHQCIYLCNDDAWPCIHQCFSAKVYQCKCNVLFYEIFKLYMKIQKYSSKTTIYHIFITIY